ncbi:hypothetical protein G6L37_00190 [Agrobacterium rubi]|nr:hypothetical protein [Agrobacterium rubi]NTF23669.1 hypothetical protein [Agrobacterium rubi]
MTSIPTASDPTDAPIKKGMTLLELIMFMGLFGLIILGFISYAGVLRNHAEVAGVITAKMQSATDLENCSVQINATRHEGKCGSFGPYTALLNGKLLFVFSGQKDDPTLVGATGFLGFRAKQELMDFALPK